MTSPHNWPPGAWFYVPIIKDPDTTTALQNINQQLGDIMALVQINSDDLAALDTALDDATASLAAKIQALVDAGTLPVADMQPLLDDVQALRDLAAPAPVVEPPAG